MPADRPSNSPHDGPLDLIELPLSTCPIFIHSASMTMFADAAALVTSALCAPNPDWTPRLYNRA